MYLILSLTLTLSIHNKQHFSYPQCVFSKHRYRYSLQRHASRCLKKKSTCFTSTKVELLTRKCTRSSVTWTLPLIMCRLVRRGRSEYVKRQTSTQSEFRQPWSETSQEYSSSLSCRRSYLSEGSCHNFDEVKDVVHGVFTPVMIQIPQGTWVETFLDGVTDKITGQPHLQGAHWCHVIRFCLCWLRDS
jgi:hypothetical protein